MIEAIKDIGEYVLEKEGKDKFLENICIKIPPEKTNTKQEAVKQHVFILNFDTKDQKIICDFEAIKEDTGRKYLWFGTARGPKPQIYFTISRISYLLSGKILKSILDQERLGDNLKNDVNKIKKLFYIEDSKDLRINPEKFDFFGDKITDIATKLERVENQYRSVKTKKDIEEITKKLKSVYDEIGLSKKELQSKPNLDEVDRLISRCHELKQKSVIATNLVKKYENFRRLEEDLLKSCGLSRDEVSIYTIQLDGRCLSKDVDYLSLIRYEKIGGLFDKWHRKRKFRNKVDEGLCSLCNKKDITTSYTTNLKLKYYMTDKIGFSSDLDGQFIKNFNLCKTCYENVLVGERYTKEKLRTWVGRMTLFVIPKLIFKNENLDIDKLSSEIKDITKTIINIESIKKFVRKLDRNQYNNTIINFLFYFDDGQKFKILKLIRDVPPTRLDDIRKVEEEILALTNERYLDNFSYKINLKKIYYSIPIGESGDRKKVAHRKYLEVIDSIFSDRKIDYNFLIDQFTEVIGIIRSNRNGFNISIKPNTKMTPDQILTDKILQLNFLLLFFSKLNLLKGGKIMGIKNLNMEGIPDEINQYWHDIEIYNDEQKRALFLLGYLIGQVGSAQSKAGHKTKPILNKINFQGMDLSRISNLSNEILEKLMQYKIRDFNENVFAAFKTLLDRNIHNWQLSNQEDVFYLLSGYAFVSFLQLKRSKEKAENLIGETYEKIERIKQKGGDVTAAESKLNDAKTSLEKRKYSEAIKKLKEIKIGDGGLEDE
jgi:CRISPR-associated protein Csh1